jgi:hypothetical protein
VPGWTSPDGDPPGAAQLERLPAWAQGVVLWGVLIAVLATIAIAVVLLGSGQPCQCEGG